MSNEQRTTSIRTFLKLVRFPLVLTAVADSVTGYLLLRSPSEVSWVSLGLLAFASACFYSAGMALNDVADANRDRTLHPERPIPSGAMSRAKAYKVGMAILGAGILASRSLGFEVFLTAVGLLTAILCYDFLLKRWRIPGALGMGLARACNLWMGMQAAVGSGEGLCRPPWQPLALGGYVFVVTLVSTLEEGGSRWKRESIILFVRTAILLIIALDAGLLFQIGKVREGAAVLALLVPSLLMVRLYRKV